MQQLGNSPDAAHLNTGPLAHTWKSVKEFIQDASGVDIGGTATAEGIDKLNAFLASASVREMTPRATQYDFKTFMQNNPGIEMSPAGRGILTDILKQTYTQDIALSKLAAKTKNPEDWPDAEEAFYNDPKNKIVVHYQGRDIDPDTKLNLPGAQPQLLSRSLLPHLKAL